MGDGTMPSLAFEVLTPVVMKGSVFWVITPYSPLKVNRRFGRTYHLRLLCLPPAFALVSCSTYSSIMKMEAVCSSDTSFDFQRTTRCYFPKDRTLHYCRRFGDITDKYMDCGQWDDSSSLYIYTGKLALNIEAVKITETSAVQPTDPIIQKQDPQLISLLYHRGFFIF
jgi:hypothetical protein